MHKYFLMLLGLIFFIKAEAQNINGVVYDKSTKQTLPGANVYWAGTTAGTITDTEGAFNLKPSGKFPKNLIVSYVGFQNDTIKIKAIDQKVAVYLQSSVEMKTVEVTGNQGAFTMSSMDKLNTENINQSRFAKSCLLQFVREF